MLSFPRSLALDDGLLYVLCEGSNEVVTLDLSLGGAPVERFGSGFRLSFTLLSLLFDLEGGLSCCFMVMRKQDRDFVLSNLTKFVEEEGFGDSTWTIDLCYILRRFNVVFRYTTIPIGVDPGYAKEAFYDKVLAKDNARVNDRFSAAAENGMVILEKSVTLDDILEHLEKNGPVIILTNANLLTCSQCSNYSSCYQFCFSARVSYQEP